MFCSLNTFEQQEPKKDTPSSAESSTAVSPVELSMECNGRGGVCGADLLSDLQYIDSEGQTTDSSSSSSSSSSFELSGRRVPIRQLTNCDSTVAAINDMALLPEVTVISKPQTQTDSKSRTSSLSELNLSPQLKSVTQSRHLKNNSPETTKKLRSSRLKKRLSATKKYLRLGHSFSNASCSSSNSSANNSRSSSTNREFHNNCQSVVKNNYGSATAGAPYASVESETIDDSPTSKTRVNSVSSIVDVTYSDGGASANTPSNSSSTSSIHRLQNGVGVESNVESACSPGDIRQSSKTRNEASSTSTAAKPAASSTTVQQCVTAGPRFKLLREGDIHVCYLNHTRTIISKILSSKFLRRWECHHLYLNDSCISSKTQTGFLEQSISYSHMEEVYVVARWDVGHKFCIRIVIPDGSLLLQAGNAYTRDQWYHSIVWKKNLFKYGHILKKSTRKDVILKELKNLVEYTTTTPLQDECVTNVPLEIISKLLVEDQESWMCRELSEILLSTIVPLLDNCPPSSEMCRFFSRHCNMHPRSPQVADCLTPIVHRILKHNVDFGKSPFMRRFVQDFLYALYSHNAGDDVLNKFVRSMHGPGSGCPHPRVLPNLVSVCLAAVFTYYENIRQRGNKNETTVEENKTIVPDAQLQCFVTVFLHISEYEDWRPGLAQLLQPIPFPDECLSHEPFITSFAPVIEKIGMDKRCEVHQMVLGVREGKEGWFHVYCPSSIVCTDSGKLWCLMLQNLFQCCCKRKRFLIQLTKQLGACLLLALRHQVATQEALCLMLEWGLIESQDQRLQVVTTLQSTACGRAAYSNLCQRQQDLEELQQKGGPRKLTLPSRSTDDDLARLLSCGSFGNLECLSLAFTHVTSACAEHLIKLPALRYLNLWATQFGDAGVQMISEHLPKLQILNLCETPVSDEGIATLSAMTNLRKLNLNSTKLSAQTFENLKKKLPKLQEFDVRYTEAW